MTKFYKYVFLGLFTLIITACGTPPAQQLYHYEIQPELKPYVDRFYYESEQRGVRLYGKYLQASIGNIQEIHGFENSPGVVGLCQIGDGPNTVTISSAAWSNTETDLDARVTLVFHELGHCILGRGHRSDVAVGGKPASIMNPFWLQSKWFTPNQDYYLDELFQDSTAASGNASLVWACDQNKI